MALNILSWQNKQHDSSAPNPQSLAAPKPMAEQSASHQDVGTLDDLSKHLKHLRFGVVAAHPDRWKDHPGIQEAMRKAHEAIDRDFALVPAGCAAMPQTIDDCPGCPETDIETRPYVLARCAVTNKQYQCFVDDKGYDNLDLWPQEIWPHLIDFRDQTDHPSPRYWREGQHDKKLANHPVVGICYYEAAAFAKWAGYRLPTEAEWQVAASWRIRSSSYVLRRYPWGDALDKQKCNIWATGVGTTVEVDACENGAAPNGVLQLVGNVWEWTSSDFVVTDSEGRPVVGDMLMKSVRGGAYDTYFPSQATSCFRTGLVTLMRINNTGFRCALDVGNFTHNTGQAS